MAPIHDAAKGGNREEVKSLIQQDPGVVHSRDDIGYIPLHWASHEGHVEVAAWLLGHGAHINETTCSGVTACYLACVRGHLPVVELLLGEGANPTIPTTGGVTALMIASREGHVGVVRCLLHHPHVMPTINHRDGAGWTALHGACLSKDHDGVVRLLLEAGADPTMANNGGLTPMELARQQGHDVCVELLEEWDRHYLLTKARHLIKRARIKAIPTYLMGRVEKGKPLPTVEVEVGDGRGGEGDRSGRQAGRWPLLEEASRGGHIHPPVV